MEPEGQAEQPRRKAKIGTHAGLKINTGNYESIDASKFIEMEVEFVDSADLAKKSAKLDKLVISLLKAEAEALAADVNRKRCSKLFGSGSPVGLWDDA